MKKSVCVVIAFALATLISSCSKNKGPSPEDTALIKGTDRGTFIGSPDDLANAGDDLSPLGATITALDGAISTVGTEREQIGAVMNRLDHTIANLSQVSVQLQLSKGRIEDADFAAETANLARTQVLQQASMAMLAQANASKQNMLALFN